MRVFTFLMIMAGVMILFSMAGVDTVSSKILTNMDVINNPEGFSFSDFFTNVWNILGGVAIVATIMAGLYFRSSPESYLLISYAAMLLLFVGDVIVIITYMNSHYSGVWASLTTLFLAPVAIGYVHSVLSWWGGKA